MLKNLSAALTSPVRLSAASSYVPLMKALLPDHKVAFWEEVKKRMDERLPKEGEPEVLVLGFFDFHGNFCAQFVLQVLSEMLKTYASCISAFGPEKAFSDPAADIPRVIQLGFNCVKDSAKKIADVSLFNVCLLNFVHNIFSTWQPMLLTMTMLVMKTKSCKSV
jgi:hypothetical protein